MDDHAQPQSGPGVEFVDDLSEQADPAGYGTPRRRWERLAGVGRSSWLALAVSGVMSAGAAVTIISVFLTQLTFRPFPPGRVSETYALDGLGHFHLVGRRSPDFSLDGHGPALGAVAIASAAALLVVAALAVLPKRRPLVAVINAGGTCLFAGAIAATLACQTIEGAGYPKYTWAVGYRLLVVGASLAVVAAIACTAIAALGLTLRSGSSAPSVERVTG